MMAENPGNKWPAMSSSITQRSCPGCRRRYVLFDLWADRLSNWDSSTWTLSREVGDGRAIVGYSLRFIRASPRRVASSFNTALSGAAILMRRWRVYGFATTPHADWRVPVRSPRRGARGLSGVILLRGFGGNSAWLIRRARAYMILREG